MSMLQPKVHLLTLNSLSNENIEKIFVNSDKYIVDWIFCTTY